MKTILIVNGEKYWANYFPDAKVVRKKIQDSDWIYRNGELLVVDAEGAVRPDGILWRIGAIQPSPIQVSALNLISIANIPCVNQPETLRIGYDRLSMLAALKQIGAPVIPFHVTTKSMLLKHIEMEFPFVVKAGNYHGGYGKVRIENVKKWQDIKDLLFITNEYITVEPFIDYQRDIRYLMVDDHIWAMSRKGKFWKANVDTTAFELIRPDEEMSGIVRKLQEKIGADVFAVDMLEDANGDLHIVEYNDIPGLSGFPDRAKELVASALRRRMEG